MVWYIVISLVIIFYLIALLDSERYKRKCLETVVAKLRDRETLGEHEVVLYNKAKKFNWQGNELAA